MKIAFIDFYNIHTTAHKDPITIPQALASLGHEVELVTRCDFDLDNLLGFKLYKIKDWIESVFIKNKPDVVIAISRFDVELTNILLEVKSHNIPLIIKGDTDGTIGYPLKPNYLRTKPIFKNPLNILRHLKWCSKFSLAVKGKITQIKLADLVVCESPKALINLTKIFDYWRIDRKKIAFIPNPVSDICLKSDVPAKTATIVSIGRWDDVECKGSDILAAVISLTHQEIKNFKFMIIGEWPDKLKKLIPENVRSNVHFLGQLNFEQTQQVLSTAQILLVPSRLESFSLASAEALCWGTSLVVTPIESLEYLADDGKFGTIAENFSVGAIKNALLTEVDMWESGIRNAELISSHWRNQLSKENIAETWEKHLNPTCNIYKNEAVEN